MTGDRARCPNVSFYGRPCTLDPHGWIQSCQFGPDPNPDENLDYDLENGSTLRDLLEALSAGGPIGIDAAMRWVEYRLYSDARDAEREIGGIVAQVKNGSVIRVQTEREIVKQYLEQRIPVAPAGDVEAPREAELAQLNEALRDANRALYAAGLGPFLPGVGQLPFPSAAQAPAWGPANLTEPCPPGCDDASPHDAHLKPGALDYLAGEGANGAQLGLATTRRLLVELQARGAGTRLEQAAERLLASLPAEVLNYRTVDS